MEPGHDSLAVRLPDRPEHEAGRGLSVNEPQDPVTLYLRSGHQRSSQAGREFDCFRQGEIARSF
jgi:hypothetical protein